MHRRNDLGDFFCANGRCGLGQRNAAMLAGGSRRSWLASILTIPCASHGTVRGVPYSTALAHRVDRTKRARPNRPRQADSSLRFQSQIAFERKAREVS